MVETLIRILLLRILFAIPLLLGVISIAFLLIHLAPGNPAYLLAGDAPSPQALARVTIRYGLDRPLWAQFLSFLRHGVVGDLGTSIYYGKSVLALIGERLPATMLLAGSAILLAGSIGTILGVLAAARPGGLRDTFISAAGLIGYSLPGFWMGQILILLFAVKLRWLPTLGLSSTRSSGSGMRGAMDVAAHLILPCLTLSSFLLATIMRYTRTAMIDVLAKDFILVARAKGVAPGAVLWRHAFPNAATTTITIIGLEFGAVIAGSVVTEVVFGWPGLGRLFYDAIFRRDFPLLIGAFIFSSASVLVINALTDMACIALDPRLRS